MRVRPNRETMKIMGRTTQVGNVLYLGFSSSYVEFETVADRISVTMCTDDKPQEESLLGWFAVYLDDAAQPDVRKALKSPEEEFVIFEETCARKVKLRLVKLSEAAFGLVGIKEFEIVCGDSGKAWNLRADVEQGRTEQGRTEQGGTEQGRTEQGRTEQGSTEQGRTEQGRTEQGRTEQGSAEQESTGQGRIGQERTGQEKIGQEDGKKEDVQQTDVRESERYDMCVMRTQDRPRRMEVIGDSITCGYGIEGVLDRDTFTTAQENPEEAYAVLTANALNADYQLVSWSGIGVITNWIPEDVNEPLEEILMPDLYRYRDKRLCEKLGLPLVEWDNAQYQPDLIVLHLGTNDDSYVRKIAERQAYFAEKYYAFLEQIHMRNPQAAILCTLGVMGQNLCEEEERQIVRFAQEHPGARTAYLVLPEQDQADGIATDSHPSKRTHQKTAAVLTKKIREFMNWQD